jgi:hypothetical protein
LALPFFAITLFISAFLLFLVQPMIGKLILPRLGGTPQVWNTCMMFFQTVLLAGYAYTHTLTSKLPTRRQLLVHAVLLALPLLVLLPWGPFGFLQGFIPPPGRNPIFDTLWALTIAVGVPFLVVSTTAPLLQRWFVHTGHPAARDPYFLYGASNLGSMLALLAYPTLIEPWFGLQSASFDIMTQTWLWAVGYIVLAVLVGGCVLMVFMSPPSVQLAGPSLPEPLPAEAPPTDPEPVKPSPVAPAPPRPATGIRKGSKQRGRHSQRPAARPTAVSAAAPAAVTAPPRPYELTWWHRLRWILLAAVPSSLMLGVTTYISTDISAIPLFWVIPLALYLLSFICVFLRWPVVWTDNPHKIMTWVQPLCLLMLVFLLMQGGFDPFMSIMVCMIAFFATALYCHGELARDRPPTKYLTEFYLWMSVGGMLGGVFNGLLAPILFVGLVEFPLALVLAGLMRTKTREEGWTDKLIAGAVPGFVDWLGDKGDDIARNFQGKPSATAADTPAPPDLRRDLPPRGWLLHYSLDVILAALLGLVFLYVRFKSGDEDGWNWASMNLKNPLLVFWYKTLNFSDQTAVRLTQYTYKILVFGVPLLICFLYSPRPLRFGLGLGALLLASTIYENAHDEAVIHADRSYFGILQVRETVARTKGGEVVWSYTSLRHGTTHHGLNYQTPADLRRLATTYYHKNGPVGIIMREIDWFPAPVPSQAETQEQRAFAEKNWNKYWSDARLPASLIGNLASPLPGALRTPLAPFPGIVTAYSEPAYACVGLGTGTMASYARPFQHMTFYEIDNKIRSFSEQEFTWPDGTVAPFFNYVHDARKRGARIEVIMGDARLSMAREQPQPGIVTPQRSHYYRMIELDAFSSDAIPVHLITKEAIQMYFEKLVEPRDEPELDKDGNVAKDAKGNPKMRHFSGGVLMVHTSNRHVDLVKPVTDIAQALGLAWRVGKDRFDRRDRASKEDINLLREQADESNRGRFGSEYVMLAKDERDLPKDNTAPEFRDEQGYLVGTGSEIRRRMAYDQYPVLWWATPRAPGNRIWTDNYSNLLGVFRWWGE